MKRCSDLSDWDYKVIGISFKNGKRTEKVYNIFDKKEHNELKKKMKKKK